MRVDTTLQSAARTMPRVTPLDEEAAGNLLQVVTSGMVLDSSGTCMTRMFFLAVKMLRASSLYPGAMTASRRWSRSEFSGLSASARTVEADDAAEGRDRIAFAGLEVGAEGRIRQGYAAGMVC